MAEKRKPSRRWTRDEDALLRRAVAKYDCRDVNWLEVASHVEGRSNKDCRKRWMYTLSFVVTKGPWGVDEDQALKTGVELHGCRWNKVSEIVNTRQADQCSRRWHECLNPKINRGRWSLLEGYILENAVRIYGRNWTEIVERFFPDRTPITAQNRYKQRLEKKPGNSNSIPQEQNREQPREVEGPTQLPLVAVPREDSHPSPSSWSGAFAYSQLPNNYSSPRTVAIDTPTSSIWEPGLSPTFPPLENLHIYSHTDISIQNQNLGVSAPRGTYQGETNYTANTPSPKNGEPFDTPFELSFDDIACPLKQFSPLELEEAFRQLCTSNTTQSPEQQQQQDCDINFGGVLSMPRSSDTSYSSHSGSTTPLSLPTSSKDNSISSPGLAAPEISSAFSSSSIPGFSPTNPPSLANLFSKYNSFAGNMVPLESFLDQIIRQLALYRARTSAVQGLGFEDVFEDAPH